MGSASRVAGGLGVHGADGMSVALEGLGLWTLADLELFDDWAVAKLDKELTAVLYPEYQFCPRMYFILEK
jgi:hypothetical protein